LNTFGHSVCAVLIFALWWHKPFGVTEPIYLRGEKAEQMLAYFYKERQKLHNNANDQQEDATITERASLIENAAVTRKWSIYADQYRTGDPWRPTKNWPPFDERGGFDRLIWLIIILACGIYGGLHAIAWKAPFRTQTEQLLWRVSACAIMCYGPFLLLIFFIINCVDELDANGSFGNLRNNLRFGTMYLENYLKAWTVLEDIDS
jgi:hypothetical protein